MKIVPFIIATAVSLIALILGVVHFRSGEANLIVQSDLQKKQQEIQELRDAIDLKNGEFQRQRQIVEQGAQVAQKYGPPILRDIGLLAAKNSNEKLKNLLVRNKLESFIPNAEQLKQIEEQVRKQQQQGGGAPAPAPANP